MFSNSSTKSPRAVASGRGNETTEVPVSSNNDTTPDSSGNPSKYPTRQLDGNSSDAYALWARRIGGPLYNYTQQHVGWAIRCPACGQLLLLEIVFDSENGTIFQPETCACGGAK
jgi:hypothetical protein